VKSVFFCPKIQTVQLEICCSSILEVRRNYDFSSS
jgi:hypothetical protein